jgi:hypothetical protein
MYKMNYSFKQTEHVATVNRARFFVRLLLPSSLQQILISSISSKFKLPMLVNCRHLLDL